MGGNAELQQMARIFILNNIGNLSLIDIWHGLHFHEKQFTYFKLKPKIFFMTKMPGY